MLEREGAGDPEAGLADPDDGDAVRVHVVPGGHRVEDRREHRLPVGAERDALLDERRLLPGAVVGHPVHPALRRRRPALEPHPRGRAVAAVGHHDQGPPLARGRVRRPEEPGGQGGVLVGDGDPLAGRLHEVHDPLPAVALPRPELRAPPGLLRVLDGVEGGRVVGRGAEEAGARGHPVARGERGLGGGPDGVGGGGPLAHPGVRVPVLHPADGGQHLARLGPSPVGAAEGDLHPELEVVVLEEAMHGRVPPVRWWRVAAEDPIRGGARARRRENPA